MNGLNPDYMPPEIGLPLAGILIIILAVIELRARKKRIEREHDDQ